MKHTLSLSTKNCCLCILENAASKCRLIFHTPIKCNTFLTTFGKRKQISFNRLTCSSAFEPFQNRLTFLKFTDEKRQGCSFQRGSIREFEGSRRRAKDVYDDDHGEVCGIFREGSMVLLP